jgi:hypothetical protein
MHCSFAIKSLTSFTSPTGPTLIWLLITNLRQITPVKTDSDFSPSPTKQNRLHLYETR